MILHFLDCQWVEEGELCTISVGISRLQDMPVEEAWFHLFRWSETIRDQFHGARTWPTWTVRQTHLTVGHTE